MQDVIQQAYDFALDYHKKDNSGHGFDHIFRVYQNVCKLLQSAENADANIAKISALLHDVDDHKLCKNGHNAEHFLQNTRLSNDVKKRILETIDAISFTKTGDNPQLDTLEKKLLFDADKLDAIGAIGICRAVAFGTSAKMDLFNIKVFPESNLTQDEYKDFKRQNNTTINHFFDKLLKLKNIMQTDAGRKEAERRHKFMVAFLDEFFAEQGASEWQNYLKDFEK